MLTHTRNLHITNVECLEDDEIEIEEHDIAAHDQERGNTWPERKHN